MQKSTQLIYNTSLMNEVDTEIDVWSAPAPAPAPTMVRGITQPKVLELLDILPRRLRRWITLGLFSASIYQSNGGRHKNGEHCKSVYSYSDWLEISLVAHLRQSHVGMKTVKTAIVFLRNHNHNPVFDCVYVIGQLVFANYVNIEFHYPSYTNGVRFPVFVEWGKIRTKADDEFSQHSIQV